ncbi:MAG: succinyl-diaminopimelate desuccinylase [Aeromonadales bacterium]|nr:succinyl-diaminopimelate desuccinylase [Aeromonadales bacterium]MDY2890394.1 succinyl-diaminopimelate desuccinylase [Succinivibrio sp.]
MELTSTQELAQRLVRIKSITPNDNGCQELLSKLLSEAGFTCITLEDQGTRNLLALHGRGKPFSLCLGHTDVVPEGDLSQWEHDPYSGDIVEIDGKACLFGRGSTDMKSGVAAMAMALYGFLKSHPRHVGTIGLLVTSNEEGDAKGGTPFCAEYLKSHGLIPDYCLIAEPSSEEVFGDEIKNGRRGDCNVTVTVHGKQGHVAVPSSCDNAAHHAARLVCAMLDNPIDQGSEFFPPTSFQVSNCHCGTGADNIVPGSFTMRCNFRYNDLENYATLAQHFEGIARMIGVKCDFKWQPEGLPYLTKGGKLLDVMKECVTRVTGIVPKFATTGGTSDGRFIAPLGAQVMEFGPVIKSMHCANEHVELKCVEELRQIYELALSMLQSN